MPDNGEEENNIIAFDGAPGEASRLNYSVPLPGSHTGRRILQLDDIPQSSFKASVRNIDESKTLNTKAGIKLLEGGAVAVGHDKAEVDTASFVSFYLENLEDAGESKATVAALRSKYMPGVDGNPGGSGSGHDMLPDGPPIPPGVDGEDWESHLNEAIKAARADGTLMVPTNTWGGGIGETPIDLKEDPKPSLFLVEIYGISSFLGDYGLGRTAKTFTLLPGESTTISMKTWRSTEESIKEGSSIVDSHHKEASKKFGESVLKETTDKKTRSADHHWYVEAEASASFGFASASVKAGGGGKYHSGRDTFAKQVSDATAEHSSQASAAREMTITSSTERKETTGEEVLVERVIKNVNMRRVLNFVFRELNQEYIVKTNLKNVRIGFTDGTLNSWREVSLPELRGLLEEVLVTAQIGPVSQQILKLIAIAFDKDDNPIKCIEVFNMHADGQDWDGPNEPALAGGNYPAPTDTRFYRFKRGHLGQDEGEAHPVEGAVMEERVITMRTDSVLVEALLGESDALDGYAMEIQKAAASRKTLENEKIEAALAAIAAIADPNERATAYAAIFNPPPAVP